MSTWWHDDKKIERKKKKVLENLDRIKQLIAEDSRPKKTIVSRKAKIVPKPVLKKASEPRGEAATITNFYKELPNKYKKEYKNPNFAHHGIKIPFRAVIVGASGGGKTVLAFEVMKRMKNTFQKVILCVKNKDEPLYEWLADKLGPVKKKTDHSWIGENLEIYEGADNVPDVDRYADSEDQILAIFDDLVLDKNQSRISQFFIRGRKIAGGISSMYLTQSYYATPKLIRQNCNYVFMLKLDNERDLKLILSEFSLGVSKEELQDLYRSSTRDKFDFLMVDMDAPPEDRFRHAFGTFN